MPNVIKYNVICLLHQKICKFISYSRISFKVTIFNGKFCVFSLLFTIYFFLTYVVENICGPNDILRNSYAIITY